MSSRGRRTWLIILAAAAALCSCAPAGAQAKLPVRTLTVQRGDGTELSLRAEIADTDQARTRGLMFRKKLPEGEGMLFVFDRDQVLSFWMKNTLIPLSIAYIASDGRILEIHDMESGSLSPVTSSRSARYALEVPQGWYAKVGIAPGDRVLLP